MVISSLIVESHAGRTAEVRSALAGIGGVEVHSVHGNSIVVSIEAASLSISQSISAALVQIPGVAAVQLVYANFEDDPQIQAKLKGAAS
ncbi:MAG: chaperone NapD [Coriobacteriales bacterium]|nr:chaperone NapD [Coriobacteriales bacterium]